jgi:hypothetical protein
VTAFEAASFQNFAAVSGAHAFAKTMNAEAAADFWLISPFGHAIPFQTMEIAGSTQYKR